MARGRRPGGGVAETRRLRGAGAIRRPAFAAAIVLAGTLGAWHATRIALATNGAEWLGVLVALLLGAVVADLLAGGVHWACDTWGDEQTRWLGTGLIRSFREHHHRPRAMLEHDWIEVNGEAAAAALGSFAVMAIGGPALALLDHPCWYAFAWSATGVSALSNQIHQWAHTHAPPRLVGKLQRCGLILSLRRHAPHHRAPCIDHYCITTGWMNPTLDGSGFWRALERWISRVTGATPRAHEIRGSKFAKADLGPGEGDDHEAARERHAKATERTARDPNCAPSRGNPRESQARLAPHSLEENA